MYEITITNLTKAQVLTPPVVALHRSGFRLFDLLGVPSPGLELLAEDGVPGDLVAELQAESEVGDVSAAEGPVLPGEAVTIVVRQTKRASHLSVVGMLATTNDAFFAILDVKLPKKWDSVDALVYDAGSEANSESCEDIPGPPCGNPGVSPLEDGEGYIHLHNGVHGVGDLVAAELDWRGPAARITIERKR